MWYILLNNFSDNSSCQHFSHIFALANAAHYDMLKTNQNQVIVIRYMFYSMLNLIWKNTLLLKPATQRHTLLFVEMKLTLAWK